MKNQRGGLSDFVTGLWNHRAILDLWFKRKSNMSYGMIDGDLGHDCSASTLLWKRFLTITCFPFLSRSVSQRFSCTCLCSRVFCPFEGCKAVSIATLCNAELGPLGYRNKVENDSSICVELSNSDHCYLLRIHSVRAQTFCMRGLWLESCSMKVFPWGFIGVRWGADTEVTSGWGISAKGSLDCE